jgi:hypothetical protein
MITGRIPLPKTGMDAFLEELQRGTKNRQAQQKIENEALANEQLNKYREGELGLEQQKFGLEKQQSPLKLDLLRAQIESQKSLSEWRKRNPNMAGMGTGGKEEQFFESLVAKDNPHLSPDQIYEASNNLRQGLNTLSDGTVLNPLSPASQASFDRLVKGTTTAGQLNQMLNAKGGEAEINVLSDYANKGLEPYGTTYKGYSVPQALDTFKSDDASQNKLGKFIGSQALQYEIAQIRNRIAVGQPGITATHELMRESQQHINSLYPRLSQKARKAASDYINEALKEGLEARRKAGISASSAVKPVENASSQKVKKWKVQDGVLVEE